MIHTKKILLVDDDEAFNFLNRIVFTETDAECDFAEAMDGRQALDYLRKNEDCPDAILLDINMPVMDGFEFLEQFEKQGKCTRRSKIFILTSSQREEDKIKSIKNGYVNGYFDKPLNTEHVKKILESLNGQ